MLCRNLNLMDSAFLKILAIGVHLPRTRMDTLFRKFSGMRSFQSEEVEVCVGMEVIRGNLCILKMSSCFTCRTFLSVSLEYNMVSLRL